MEIEFQIRETVSGRLVGRQKSEKEVANFLNSRPKGMYFVWEVEVLTGRVRYQYEGTNLDKMILKYDLSVVVTEQLSFLFKI